MDGHLNADFLAYAFSPHHHLLEELLIPLADQREKFPSEDLIFRDTQDLSRHLVGKFDPGFFIEDDDPIISHLGNLFEAFRGLTDLPRHPLLFGDIPQVGIGLHPPLFNL